MKSVYIMIGIILITWTTNKSYAQLEIVKDVIGSCGSFAVQTNGFELSQTVGEVGIATLEQGNFVLQEGFQQALFLLVLPVEEKLNDFVRLALFPNPASHQVGLKTENKAIRSYEILSLNGQLVQEGGYRGGKIDISTIPTGFYILKAYGNARKYLGHARLSKR